MNANLRRLTLLSVAFLVCLLALPRLASSQAAGEADHLRGFSADDARAEAGWEAKFRALPQPTIIRATMQHLSALPHELGSPRDHENAEWILAKFKSFGIDAHLEKFEVLFPTPKERLVELLEPERYTAQLKEPAVAEDPNSTDPGQLPTYNAYSADGDVTGQLVYVNYGVPADYEVLAQQGVDVKGKIVIARYGGSWRGIKPKVAYEHGAIGCLIYSDPKDDGYAAGDVYPKGPYRPAQGVQRGSVMEMELYPGDPETPGTGSVPGAKRLPLDQVQNLQKIPVLPISYGDALPLLKALAGPVAPAEWRGALPITYHLGGGPAVVHLVAKFNWNIVPLYDVIATIPGSTYPDQWVIRGNHHDAWVNGAEDPLSGLSALLEEARGFGELLKQGWRPKRTIIMAAWDGEEPALLGSTEWAETHADELSQKAVAYINSDTNDKGHLNVAGSHGLERFANEFAKDIPDPVNGASAWTKVRDLDLKNATGDAKKELQQRPDLRIEALGSGSDYSPFLQHLGVASLNLGYEGEAGGGIYHSIYDSFYWYTHFSDTTFVYGRALAQTAGTAVMRLADSDVLPFEFTDLADTVNKYVGELKTLQHDAAGTPSFDFSGLEAATSALQKAAADYGAAYQAAAADGKLYAGSDADRARLNQLLFHSERALLSPAGLPRRPWYKHQLYAPGFYTGYGVKTMPGVREALEQKNWQEAASEQAVVVTALRSLTAAIEHATALVEK